ncbi:MAG: signal peptidase II [Pseudomonadota bacterium]
MTAPEAGRLRRLGLITAFVGLVLDQATKLWLLFVYELEFRQPVALLPVFDLVAVWNRGISYGLFQQNTEMGRAILLGITAIALVFMSVWLWRAQSRLVVLALGLIIGGAIGNGIDRVAYGAVFDFAHFHFRGFSWYIFNLADVWIVAGVVGLLIDAFRDRPENATKRQ